jgi:hypothetical protein
MRWLRVRNSLHNYVVCVWGGGIPSSHKVVVWLGIKRNQCLATISQKPAFFIVSQKSLKSHNYNICPKVYCDYSNYHYAIRSQVYVYYYQGIPRYVNPGKLYINELVVCLFKISWKGIVYITYTSTLNFQCKICIEFYKQNFSNSKDTSLLRCCVLLSGKQ